MCGIGSMGLFQNRGEGCKESVGHAICGRRGLQTAGIVDEAGGPVSCGSPEGAEAPRLVCVGCGNSEPRSPSATCGLRGGLSRVRATFKRRLAVPDLFSRSDRSFSNFLTARASFLALTCTCFSFFSCRLVSFVASQISAFRFASVWVASFWANTRSQDSV